MSRIVILCPGRGSYTRKTRNGLDANHPFVSRAEAVRAEYELPSLLELDANSKWQNDLHLRPDNVSPLIWLYSMIDASSAMESHDAVAVAGNSMGWYTALAVAGALDFEDGFRLVQEMSILQMAHADGGQVLYPIVDDDWRADPTREAAVQAALERPGTYESIRLGGFVVLAGTEDGVREILDAIPEILVGMSTFPARLTQHGPYHTELLADVADRAAAQLARLGWRAPKTTLIDGAGRRYSPWSSDPNAIRDYTLGDQIRTMFDFSASVHVGLREFAPDLLCLPGPGNTLGSICAQIAIAERWRGMDSRATFETVQESDAPLVWSMRR
jgi:[acyl-carrier-protein] S-malonyltransferase